MSDDTLDITDVIYSIEVTTAGAKDGGNKLIFTDYYYPEIPSSVDDPENFYELQKNTEPKAGEINTEQLNNKYPDNMPAQSNDADLNPWDVEIFG